MSQDASRIAELNLKLTAYGGKAPGTAGVDNQTNLDNAHALRIIKDEIRDKRGS
jgi:hypothetical protein